MSDLKTCPLCAEQIQAAAVVCKHCQREVREEVAASPRRSLFTPMRVAVVAAATVVVIVTVGMVSRSETAPREVSRTTLPPLLRPVTVTDQVQNIPANAWKAVPLDLPYSGDLE